MDTGERKVPRREDVMDFESVTVGAVTVKSFAITNRSETATDFDVIMDDSSNYLERVFEVRPLKVTIESGATRDVCVRFAPIRSNMSYVDYFSIFDSHGLHCALMVKGRSIGPCILATKTYFQLETFHDEVKTASFELKNFSEVRTSFHFDNDNESSIFKIHPSSSIIEGNESITVIVNFCPQNEGSFEKRVFCLLEYQAPVVIHLVGLNGRLSGMDECPKLIRCPLLKARDSSVDNYEAYIGHEWDGIIEINPKYSLKFSRGSSYERLALTNITRLPLTLVWNTNSLRAFCVTPTLQRLIPGTTFFFNVQYDWRRISSKRCHKNNKERNVEEEYDCSTASNDLEGWLYWEDEGTYQSTACKPWFDAQEYQTNKWESSKIPVIVTVKLIGQHIKKPPKVSCDTFPGRVIFPSSYDGRPVYAAFYIKNFSGSPVVYQLIPPAESDFTAKPMEGVITKDVQVIVLRLMPKSATLPLYLEQWVVKFNGCRHGQKPVILAGICEGLDLTIGCNNTVTFPPVQLGCAQEKVVQIRNRSTQWIKLKYATEKVPMILNAGSSECLLAPNELLEQQWIFRPKTTGKQNIFIEYVAFAAKDPHITELNDYTQRHLNDVEDTPEDKAEFGCKRQFVSDNQSENPLTEEEGLISSYHGRDYYVTVKTTCLDDTVIIQPNYIHLTDFISSQPASSTCTLSNLGDAAVPYSLSLVCEPDAVVTADPNEDASENHSNEDSDKYSYEISPNKGILWPKSSTSITFIICSRSLKAQGYSIQMEVIQSDCTIEGDKENEIQLIPRKLCCIYCEGMWPKVRITNAISTLDDPCFNKATLWRALNMTSFNRAIRFDGFSRRKRFHLKFPGRPLKSPPVTYSFTLQNLSSLHIQWSFMIVHGKLTKAPDIAEPEEGMTHLEELIKTQQKVEAMCGNLPNLETFPRHPKSKTSLRTIGCHSVAQSRMESFVGSTIEIEPMKGVLSPKGEEMIRMRVLNQLRGAYTFTYNFDLKMAFFGEGKTEDSKKLAPKRFPEVISDQNSKPKRENKGNEYFNNDLILLPENNRVVAAGKELLNKPRMSKKNSKAVEKKKQILQTSKRGTDAIPTWSFTTHGENMEPEGVIDDPNPKPLLSLEVYCKPWKALWTQTIRSQPNAKESQEKISRSSEEESLQREIVAKSKSNHDLKGERKTEQKEQTPANYRDFIITIRDLAQNSKEDMSIVKPLQQSERQTLNGLDLKEKEMKANMFYVSTAAKESTYETNSSSEAVSQRPASESLIKTKIKSTTDPREAFLKRSESQEIARRKSSSGSGKAIIGLKSESLEEHKHVTESPQETNTKKVFGSSAKSRRKSTLASQEDNNKCLEKDETKWRKISDVGNKEIISEFERTPPKLPTFPKFLEGKNISECLILLRDIQRIKDEPRRHSCSDVKFLSDASHAPMILVHSALDTEEGKYGFSDATSSDDGCLTESGDSNPDKGERESDMVLRNWGINRGTDCVNVSESKSTPLASTPFRRPSKTEIITNFTRLIQPVETGLKKLRNGHKTPITANIALDITVTAYGDDQNTALVYPELYSNKMKMEDVCVTDNPPPLQVKWLYNPHNTKSAEYAIESIIQKETIQNQRRKIFECLNSNGIIEPGTVHPLIFQFDPAQIQLYKATALIRFKDCTKEIYIEGRGVDQNAPTFKTIQQSLKATDKPESPVCLSNETLVFGKPIPAYCKAIQLNYLVNYTRHKKSFEWKNMVSPNTLTDLVDVNIHPAKGILQPFQVLPLIVSFSNATKKESKCESQVLCFEEAPTCGYHSVPREKPGSAPNVTKISNPIKNMEILHETTANIEPDINTSRESFSANGVRVELVHDDNAEKVVHIVPACNHTCLQSPTDEAKEKVDISPYLDVALGGSSYMTRKCVSEDPKGFNESCRSSKKRALEIHFAPYLDIAYIDSSEKRKVNFNINNQVSSETMIRKVCFDPHTDIVHSDSPQCIMGKNHFAFESDMIESSANETEKVHFDKSEDVTYLESCSCIGKNACFASNTEFNKLILSKTSKNADDSIPKSPDSRQKQLGSITDIMHIRLHTEEANNKDVNTWQINTNNTDSSLCCHDDGGFLVECFPLDCELHDLIKDASGKSFPDEDSVLHKQLNISGSVYNEEAHQTAGYSDRVTWSPNDVLLCNDSKCVPNFDLPVIQGRNADDTINDVLESMIWQLLFSEWFEVTLAQMERSTEDRRKHSPFQGKTDRGHDDVPTYRQIVTADKCPTDYSDKARRSKPTIWPGSCCVSRASEGKGLLVSRPAEVDPRHSNESDATILGKSPESSVTNHPPVPPILVSRVFEDLMTQLASSLFRDMFEQEYDVEQYVREYANGEDDDSQPAGV